MPTVKLVTSQKLVHGDRESLALELTGIAAGELNKPTSVTQAVVTDDTVIAFGGDFTAPSAFIEVTSVGGFSRDVCRRLCAAFCSLLEKYGITPQRVYICFNDKKGEEFGWNSNLLG